MLLKPRGHSPMKLKLMETEFGVALCDENGAILPNQMEVRLVAVPDDAAKVHVTFIVGGDLSLDRRMEDDVD